MIHSPPIPDLDIPKCNVLSFLFPEDEPLSDTPIWFDAANVQKHVSPRQMVSWVKRLIIGLDKLGVQQGDVCMIHTPNHVLVPAAYLGIVGGARAFSAANPIYTVDEIVHQLRLTDAKCIFAHPSLVEKDIEAAKRVGMPLNRIYQFDDKPCEERHGIKDFRAMLGSEAEAAQHQWLQLRPEEAERTIATINFSSGTTGLPKGVMISHYALVANVMQTFAVRWPNVNFKAGENPGERWVGFLPLYHAYGQLYANLMAAKSLTPMYIMKQFVYTEFLRVIQEHKITHLQVAPPVLVMMSKRPETKDYDLSSLQGAMSGGAPLGPELQNDIMRKFNCQVKNGWGMTEVTCGSILQYDVKDNGTVGKLIPNNYLRLVDDNNNEVGFDTPGEMLIKAPNVMLGYWKNPTATRESLENGWLRTGDIAVINKEGYIWIVDRKKELIKVNALQVAPAELEGKLLENDFIADAAACGIQISGEEWPRAYVVLSESAKSKNVTAKDIQEWFRPRVAKHKALVGGVKFVDEIPKLPSGKIQRKVLREWAKNDVSEVEKSFNRARL